MLKPLSLWSFMNNITRVKFHILFTTFPTATPVQHRGEDSRVSAIFQKSSALSQTSLKRSIQHSVLVQDFLALKFKFNSIVSFRNRILISVVSTSWTRMECAILVPVHSRYRLFADFGALKMSEFTKHNFSTKLAFD